MDLVSNDANRVDADTGLGKYRTGPSADIEGPGVHGTMEEMPLQVPFRQRPSPVGTGLLEGMQGAIHPHEDHLLLPYPHHGPTSRVQVREACDGDEWSGFRDRHSLDTSAGGQ